MRIPFTWLVLASLFLFSNYGYADAPLKSKLAMSTDQSREVSEIQKKYRSQFRSKRQELHKENRKLRRARNENDSGRISQQEKITADLQKELQQIRLNEDEEIRHVLTPEQKEKFEAVIQERKDMVGSSRDTKDF